MSQQSFLRSSVGLKTVMALSGVVLFGFIVIHLLGNLQVFVGQEAMNSYAKLLKSMPAVLWTARIALLGVILAHILSAVQLKRLNMAARPEPYVYQNTVQATLSSRTMFASGTIVLLYILYHLAHFTLGYTHPEYFHRTDALGRHDVYTMVVLSFSHLSVSAIYVIAMGLLCFHLSHGIASFFQTLGFNNPRIQPVLRQSSVALAAAIFVGYVSIPVAILLGFVTLPQGGV